MRTIRKAALAAAVALLCQGAQAASPPPLRVVLSIEQQPLRTALKSLAEQTGLQIMRREEDAPADGMMAPRLVGEMSPREALDKLLASSGLTYRFLNDRTVRIVKAGQQSGPYGKDARAPAEKTPGVEGDGPLVLAQSRPRESEEAAATQGNPMPDHPGRDREPTEEIIVTAQKRAERLQDVPLPVTAINGESLSASNQTRLEDYYSKVPGLSLATVQPFGSSTLAIRGVVTGYFQSPTVGIVVDDVPYTSSTTVGFGNAVSDLDPSDLARVEVLRGPQGTLYGASSMGGLIKYVTLDPSLDGVSGRVQGGVDSVAHGHEPGYNVRGAVNVPLSDTFALRASVFTRRDAGYIDDPANGAEDLNWGRTSGGRLSMLWRPAEAISLKLGALLQDSRVHGSAEVDVLPGLEDLQQNRVPGSGGYRKSFQVYSANLTAQIGAGELATVTAYASNENEFMWDFSGQLGALARDGIPGFFTGFGVDGVTSTQDVKTNKLTQEVRYSLPLGARVDWLIGGFYGREKTPRNLQTVPVVVFETNQRVGELAHLIYLNTFQEYAAFTDLTFHFTDRFDVQIGGRQSHNEQDFQNITGGPLFSGDGGADNVQPQSHSKNDAFTYLLTPRWKIADDLMVYARLASGYRPGGPNGGVALNSAFPREYGSDKTQSYEVGLKSELLDRRLAIDASLYYIDWRDIQLQLADPVAFLTYYDNAGRARSKGMELALGIRPLEGLSINASGSWGDAELTQDFPIAAGSAMSGDRLPFSSRFAGTLSIEDEFPLSAQLRAFVGGSVSYVGDRPGAIGARGPRLSSYTRTDLQAGVRHESWTATLFGNNITDRRGVLNAQFPTAFTYIQPRTVGLTFSRSL